MWEVPGPTGTRFSSIHHVERTGSTNADLLHAAAEGAPTGRVLVTDHQVAGRGRQGRTWHDEPGTSLLVSVLLRPPPSWAALVPLLAGVAVAEAVEAVAGSDAGPSPVGLKWPNDVLVPSRGERKLAGILAESTAAVDPATGARGLAVVVGIGVNIRPSTTAPPEVAARAVAIHDLGPATPTRDEVAAALLVALDRGLAAAEAGGAEAVLAAYRPRCATIGRSVRFETPTEIVEGTAAAVADDGALVIDTDAGSVTVQAGDAHHR